MASPCGNGEGGPIVPCCNQVLGVPWRKYLRKLATHTPSSCIYSSTHCTYIADRARLHAYQPLVPAQIHKIGHYNSNLTSLLPCLFRLSLSLFHSIQSYNSPFPLTTAAFLIAGLDTLYKYLITFHTVESYQQAGHVLTISIFSPSLQKQDFYTLLFISVSFFLSKKSKKAKSTCFGRVFHHWLSFLWCLQQSWTLHPL